MIAAAGKAVNFIIVFIPKMMIWIGGGGGGGGERAVRSLVEIVQSRRGANQYLKFRDLGACSSHWICAFEQSDDISILWRIRNLLHNVSVATSERAQRVPFEGYPESSLEILLR